jgi:hypothetical protein
MFQVEICRECVDVPPDVADDLLCLMLPTSNLGLAIIVGLYMSDPPARKTKSRVFSRFNYDKGVIRSYQRVTLSLILKMVGSRVYRVLPVSLFSYY